MFCKNCGSALKDGTKFCPFCGTYVNVISTETPAATPSQEPAPETEITEAQTVSETSESIAENEPVTEVTEEMAVDELIGETDETVITETEDTESAQTYAAPDRYEPPYAAPAPVAPKPETAKTPFRRALAKIAASPLFLAFAIVFTVAVSCRIFNTVSFIMINGVTARLNFNLTPLLSVALGIVSAVALFKLHSSAKQNPDSREVLGGANTYVIYREVVSWLNFALMILLIISVVLLLVVTVAPNSIIKDVISSIDWTRGLSFNDSFDELISADVIDAVYRYVPYIDDVWHSAVDGIYTAASTVGLSAPADILYMLYLLEIGMIAVFAAGAVGTIFSAIYFIKLRKFVSRVRQSAKTDIPFKSKSGYISFFSIVFAVFYVFQTLSTLFTAPLSAAGNGASAAALIMLMLIIRKFNKALNEENSNSISE